MLPLGGLSLRVMETPGHSEGSVCLLLDREHVIFCRRYPVPLLLRTMRLPRRRAIPRCSPPWAGWRRWRATGGSMPGHDRATTLDFERRMNPYMPAG